MGNEILKKIDMFVDEASVYSTGHPNSPKSEWDGVRAIQFMNWWKNFRPGDRVDVMFGEDYVSFGGTNAEGHFAGVKKESYIDDPKEMDEFKGSEGRIWNFV